MRRTALIAVLALVTACSQPATIGGSTTSTGPGATPTTVGATITGVPGSSTIDPNLGFPVTVEADNGPVTIDSRPLRVVSLSAVATETLFEIGAGAQVVAVDEQSNHPPEAPITDLSGFTPNLEALLSYDPDLVVIAYDPGDLVTGLEAVGVPVLHLDAAIDIDGVYHQIEVLGDATGNRETADQVNREIRAGLEEAVARAGGGGEGLTYYHEIDSNLYTVTSSTFFGQIYGLFGMVNIADEADEAGSGYPQLSSEYVVLADPNLIFLADTAYGESAETVAARPGWDVMTAVRDSAIIGLDSDIASRWGPRIVDLAQAIADGVLEHG
jgi:iron complex transport system substrate-binding protein